LWSWFTLGSWFTAFALRSWFTLWSWFAARAWSAWYALNTLRATRTHRTVQSLFADHLTCIDDCFIVQQDDEVALVIHISILNTYNRPSLLRP
jgi:hypothetical protein